MASIDKLVSYAELKLGQFGADYRENHEEDNVQEIQPNGYAANGTSIDVNYDSQSYVIDLTQAGEGDVTEAETQEVVARLKEFFNQ